MRRSFSIAMALFAGGVLFPDNGLAQQRDPSSASTRESSPEPGELTTYGTRDVRALAAERQAYSRPAPTPRLPSPAVLRSHAAVFSQTRNYHPGMRPSQGPNHNVVDPKTLCVPGRRALLQR